MTTSTKTGKKDLVLSDLFLDELADIYDAENRLIKALPKMAKAAASNELRSAIESHLKETEEHRASLESVFEAFDMKAKGKKCEAIEGLVKEADEIAKEFKGSSACDAAIISACQKVEHYEIASYGCLVVWAELLQNEDATEILSGILEEEKAADDALTQVARTMNAEAMSGEADSDEEIEEEEAPKKSKSPRRS